MSSRHLVIFSSTFILFVFIGITLCLKGILFQAPELSTQEIAQTANPAIVTIVSGNSQGSGFIVREHGTIVTNAHILRGYNVSVKFHNNTTADAIVTSVDDSIDIAVLTILGTGKHAFLEMADSDKCKQGDPVMAIGTPLSLQNTLTKGIVSAVRKDKGFTYIQTDTAVNPGNSGGPLLNTHAEVVGVNTFGAHKSIAEGINFAVSINDVKDLIEGKRRTDNVNIVLERMWKLQNDEETRKRQAEEQTRRQLSERQQAIKDIATLQEMKKQDEDKRRAPLIVCLNGARNAYTNSWNAVCKKEGRPNGCSMSRGNALRFDALYREAKADCYRLYPLR